MCMFYCRYEQAFVNSLVFGRSDDHFWLGLHNENSTGPFCWLTGEQLTYTNWNRDQPGTYTEKEHTLMGTELFYFHTTLHAQQTQLCFCAVKWVMLSFHASENDKQIWPDLPNFSYMIFRLAYVAHFSYLLLFLWSGISNTDTKLQALSLKK